VSQQMHVQTVNGHYLQAPGGSGEITARGPWPREDETFTLVSAEGQWREVEDGSQVQLRTRAGRFVTTSGADGVLSATATDPSTPESRFTVVAAAGEPRRLEHFGRFGLRAANGMFVCAENGGGSLVRANRSGLGPWETFQARHHPEPADCVLTTSIRTVSGMHFLQATNGGGADLSARGPHPLSWETFDIVAADRASRGFPSGGRVHVRTDSWHYLQAESGGGGKVSAAGPWPREWETFTLEVPGRRPWLRPGARFGLRSANGRYVAAEQGGGGAVTAVAASLTPAATFTATGAVSLANAPVRVVTGTAAREDSTSATTFTELVPTPGQGFSTGRTATITALFTAECRVSTAGAALEARIVVDGQVAHPGTFVLTRETQHSVRSCLAFLTGVQPGHHLVTLQWRVTAGQGFVRNRSFTVYEVQ
jgi:hypothetical protein